MKNIENWLKSTSKCSWNVHRSIIKVVAGKSGLVSCQSDSEFDEILQNVMRMWVNIEKKCIKDPKSKFSYCFIRNKADKIKSKLTKSAPDKINFDGNYYQNCVESSHYITKSEIWNARVKGAHKTGTLVHAFMSIKNKKLRMYHHTLKVLLDEGSYIWTFSWICSLSSSMWMLDDQIRTGRTGSSVKFFFDNRHM